MITPIIIFLARNPIGVNHSKTLRQRPNYGTIMPSLSMNMSHAAMNITSDFTRVKISQKPSSSKGAKHVKSGI